MKKASVIRFVQMQAMCAFLAAVLLFMLQANVTATAGTLPARDTDAPAVSPEIVIGFVGGFVRQDDKVHGVVQLGERLRKQYGSNVYIEIVENHSADKAFRDVLHVLDADHSGKLSDEEKKNARIIIYGHSWGASETVTLARELAKDRIPVLLTVQVDSIAKSGENDAVIPANVAQAINLYQSNGFLHGRAEIRAADPSHTQILGNFRYDYGTNAVNCDSQYPWWDRVFMRPHTDMECDPKVWDRVETLIRAKLSQAQMSS